MTGCWYLQAARVWFALRSRAAAGWCTSDCSIRIGIGMPSGSVLKVWCSSLP